jgi:membrane protein implicated in regulation of membrane protease activity
MVILVLLALALLVIFRQWGFILLASAVGVCMAIWSVSVAWGIAATTITAVVFIWALHIRWSDRATAQKFSAERQAESQRQADVQEYHRMEVQSQLTADALLRAVRRP